MRNLAYKTYTLLNKIKINSNIILIICFFLYFFLNCYNDNIAFANTKSKGEITQSVPIDVVFHGSPNNNISIILPAVEHIRNGKEGPVVFATPSIALASCYLFRWDDSWVHQFISDNSQTGYEVYMIIGNKEKFYKLNNGGTIYLLPIHSFTFNKVNKKLGLGIYEYTSKESITPFTKIRFTSPLHAMKLFGVKVYFLNDAQFSSYLKFNFTEREKFLERFNPA